MAWLEDSIEEFKKLPTWGKIAVGVGAVGVVGVGVYMHNKAVSAGATLTNGPASASPTTASNQAGIPAGSVDNGQGATMSQTATPTATPAGTTQIPTTMNLFAAIRSKFSRPGATNDQNYQGIPIHQSADPNSAIVGYAPFGGQQQLSSAPPVQGASNLAHPKAGGDQGSTLWYQTPTGGYISAYDVTSTYQQPSGGGQPTHWYLQFGQNLNEVAAQLRLPGGWQAFGDGPFRHGDKVKIPR